MIEELMQLFDDNPGSFYTFESLLLRFGHKINRGGLYRVLRRLTKYPEYVVLLIYLPEKGKYVGHYGKEVFTNE